MSQYALLKQVQLPKNSSIRINHHLYYFKIVTALDNLCVTFTCAIKGNKNACFLRFMVMLIYSNIKKKK